MIRRSISFMVAGALAASPLTAQQHSTDSIRIVVADHPVEIGHKQYPLVEPSLAVDPRDPKHLLIGVIVEKKSDMSDADCVSAVSFDGGISWSTHEFGLSECADPFVEFNAKGEAMIALLSSEGSMVTYTSPDGGRSWSNPFRHSGADNDHGTLAVDRTNGKFKGAVYVTSQSDARDAIGRSRPSIYIARSDDGGRTYPQTLQHVASNVSLTSMNPGVFSDGRLLVTYSDYSRPMPDGSFARLRAGRDWAMASLDGGKSFGAPALITEACSLTFPVLRIDTASTKLKDRAYYVCNDGLFEKIWLHVSTDKGERWSDPIQVNRGSTRQPHVRTPAIGVNRDGAVLISWYDARATGLRYRQNARCQEFFVSASIDGAATFLPEVKVSTDRNCPDTQQNGESGRRFPGGGDYTGLAADSNGRFHLVWPDSRSGVYQLRHAVVEVGKSAV